MALQPVLTVITATTLTLVPRMDTTARSGLTVVFFSGLARGMVAAGTAMMAVGADGVIAAAGVIVEDGVVIAVDGVAGAAMGMDK